MKVIEKKINRIFSDVFKIDRAVIQYEKFDGTMSEDVVRLNFERGHSVAVLIVNPQKKSLIFTKQFRYPAYIADKNQGWLLEIVAGSVESGADFLETAKQEVREEVGYIIDQLIPIYVFFPSPGGSSEKIFLYYTEVNEQQKSNRGGGLIAEGEDIQIVELPIEKALKLLETGKIHDAKTIIALQWLKQRRE